MTKAEQPTITQTDRDAADALFSTMDYPRAAPEHVVQAFARHRTASLAAQDGLVEAIRGLRENDGSNGTFHAGKCYDFGKKIDAALSAIKGDKS